MSRLYRKMCDKYVFAIDLRPFPLWKRVVEGEEFQTPPPPAVHNLSVCWRHRYVQFGEGQLLVPVEDSTAAEPYVLGTHVIPLALTQPSSHAENWEKLNTALTYIHDHFFNYDFYLKVGRLTVGVHMLALTSPLWRSISTSGSFDFL